MARARTNWASVWRAGFALSLAGALLACGDEQRPPPPRGDDPEDDVERGPDAGDVFFDDLTPMLPPEALGLCGATVVELEVVRPNLYFLVDASGSMTDSIPAMLPQNRFNAARNAIEQVLRGMGHRVNYGAAIFPDDPNGCGPGREIHPTSLGDPVSYALAGRNGPQLTNLVNALDRITPEGATPTAVALSELHDTLVDLPGETFLFLLTDGAPNCNVGLSCSAAQCTANIERLYYTDHDVCDESVNCCISTLWGPTSCLDAQATTDAVSALYEEGVRTFVIGMPGTEAYGALLDTLAEAGGTAREKAPHYYQVIDSNSLVTTLQDLGGDISLGCTIELNEVPPDPGQVNVFMDDTLLPFDENEGWSWLDEGNVQLHGEACELAETGQVLQIQVVAGCPVVIR